MPTLPRVEAKGFPLLYPVPLEMPVAESRALSSRTSARRAISFCDLALCPLFSSVPLFLPHLPDSAFACVRAANTLFQIALKSAGSYILMSPFPTNSAGILCLAK